jgi:hypothetical protein
MAEYLTVAEVSDRLKVCKETIRRYVRSGLLRPILISKKIRRFSENDLARLLLTLTTSGELPLDTVATSPAAPGGTPAPAPKPKREAKKKASKPKESPPAWVTDYDAYFEMAIAAYNDLYNNEAFIAKQMARFAGYTAEDIKVAITASFDNFWLTEDRGWPNKVAAYKKSKVGRINWPATIAGKLDWNLPPKPKVYGGGGNRFGPQNLDTPEAKKEIFDSYMRVIDKLQKKEEMNGG